MSTTTDPQVLRKVTRTAVRLIAEDVASKLLVGAAMDKHGIGKDDVEAWNNIYDGVLGTIGAALAPLTRPAEQLQDPRPWPRAQRMPLAIVGQRPQPWHHQALAEYGAATGIEMEPNPNVPGGYVAAQINWAISWWNERVEREQADDPFAMIAEDCPAGPAYAVAEHWFSHAALISDSVGDPEWHAIASLTRRILDLMDEERAERDGDVQAVAEAVSILEGMLDVDAWAYDAGRARNVLLDCFARELDALEARDAKAGE